MVQIYAFDHVDLIRVPLNPLNRNFPDVSNECSSTRPAIWISRRNSITSLDQDDFRGKKRFQSWRDSRRYLENWIREIVPFPLPEIRLIKVSTFRASRSTESVIAAGSRSSKGRKIPRLSVFALTTRTRGSLRASSHRKCFSLLLERRIATRAAVHVNDVCRGYRWSLILTSIAN